MKAIFFLTPLVLLTALPCLAQEKVDMDMMARIREEGLNRSQLPETLSYLTEVIGPRLTGSPGLLRANEWTKSKLTGWGLVNGKLEPWGPFGRGWTCEKFSLTVTGPTPFTVISCPKAWSPSVKAKGELVYLDVTDAAGLDAYKGKLKGKVVLFGALRPVAAHFTAQGERYTDEQLAALSQPQAPRPGGGGGFPGGGRPGGAGAGAGNFAQQLNLQRVIQTFLKTEGVAAVLDAGRGDGGTVFVQQATVVPPPAPPTPPTPPADGQPGPGAGGPFGGGGAAARRISPWKKEADGKIVPQIAVSAEHFNRLARMVKAGEKVQVDLELKTKLNGNDDSMVSNTTAEIPGSDKADEIVMCGGHLDSWHGGTGATDNAAGVSVGMEAVRILKALGVKPRRTIRIGLWTGEEQGIFGSTAYVREHFGTASTPKPEYDKFSAYFNLDNGTGKIRGVWCQGNDAVMPIFSEWLKPFSDLGATTVTRRNTGGTDHLPFDSAGLPGFQFIQDTIEYDTRTHHSNQDTFDRIQIDDMKQAAVVMAAFLYNASMRDDKLPRKMSFVR
ncbi:MAG: M20/M25/M40 family metallo-hydrolase [Armatimonas sp.]